MWEDTYCVEVDGEVVARGLDLKIATILIRALFEEYWNDKYMVVSVKKEDLGLDDDIQEVIEEDDNNEYS